MIALYFSANQHSFSVAKPLYRHTDELYGFICITQEIKPSPLPVLRSFFHSLQDRRSPPLYNRSTCTVLGITMDGHKDILGMWICEHEIRNCLLNALKVLKGRGVSVLYRRSARDDTGHSESVFHCSSASPIGFATPPNVSTVRTSRSCKGSEESLSTVTLDEAEENLHQLSDI